jgi:hypothetical protein
MKKLLLLALSLTALTVQANIANIDFVKVTKDKTLLAELGFVKDNLSYYYHWSAQWEHDITRVELIAKLEGIYTTSQAKGIKGAELHLLLGDLSHYMYNLEADKYYQIAVGHYTDAAKSAPKDYRTGWFLANHYATSNNPMLAVTTFKKTEKLLPAKPSADFWEEYAYCTALANMPSHSLYAMSKSQEITGKQGNMEKQLGMIVQKNIQMLDRNKEYEATDIWDATEGQPANFTCRPLGLSVAIDSTWGINIPGYQNRSGAFIVFPPKIKSKSGKEISYTVGILMHTANDDEKLEDYVTGFDGGGGEGSKRKKIQFSTRYANIVAYEITNPNDYADMGGGHFYLVGVEREAPDFPGLLLEQPKEIPGKSGEMQFFSPGKSQERFGNRIFYAFMLDTCEDIHTDSLAVFKDFFEKQVVLE